MFNFKSVAPLLPDNLQMNDIQKLPCISNIMEYLKISPIVFLTIVRLFANTF